MPNPERIDFNNATRNEGSSLFVLDAIKLNVPQLSWNTKYRQASFANIPTNATTYANKPIDSYTGRPLNWDELNSLRNETNKVAREFNQLIANENITGEALDLAKVMYIYNYILFSVKYSDVYFNENTQGYVDKNGNIPLQAMQSAFSALVLHDSICVGISDAIYLLCNLMGVECEKHLWPSGRHAFNKVKVGGIWYKLDATATIGFEPKSKAEKWDDMHFLTPIEQPNSNQPHLYPRNRIQAMKSFFESKGLSFNYPAVPKINMNVNSIGRATPSTVDKNNQGPAKKIIFNNNTSKNTQNLSSFTELYLSQCRKYNLMHLISFENFIQWLGQCKDVGMITSIEESELRISANALKNKINEDFREAKGIRKQK